jgi:hypothetical protein
LNDNAMTSADISPWREGVTHLQAVLSGRAERRREPNFFRIVPRLLRNEGVHSDLLAWLLDPAGWHGLGDAFARRFVGDALAATSNPFTPPLTVTRVHTEFSTGRGPIDVLIEGTTGDGPFLLGIENKIDSPVSRWQLSNYACGLVNQSRGRNVALVLLAPTELDDTADVQGCSFGTMTYRSVVSGLEAALGETTVSGAGIELARHYLDILRTNIVPTPETEIDRLLSELYRENKDAWKLIRRRLPSERDEHHVALAEAICSRLTRDLGGPWQFSLRPDRYVRVFMPHWGTPFGQSEPERIVGLGLEGAPLAHFPHVHFRLSTDAPDDDAGDERWRYIAKLRLDTRANPHLGVLLRTDLESLGLRVQDRPQDTPVIKSAKQRGIEDGVVHDDVVEWFAAKLIPVADRITHRLAAAGTRP